MSGSCIENHKCTWYVSATQNREVCGMKKIIAITIPLIISGCDNSSVNVVKKQDYPTEGNYSNTKVLDGRSVCESTEWVENKESNTVSYICRLKKGKRFFSFNEDYANKLRDSTYEQAIKNKKKFDEESIEAYKKNIEFLKNQNIELEGIEKRATEVNVYEFVNEYSNNQESPAGSIIWHVANEFSKTADGRDFTEKAMSNNLFGSLISLWQSNLNVYDDAYNYLNNKKSDYRHIYEDAINSTESACRYDEHEKNKAKLLNDEQWIKKIDAEHREKMKPLCEQHLNSYGMVKEDKKYQPQLAECLDNSYKPEYKKLAEQEANRQKSTNSCEVVKNEKIKELKELTNRYSSLMSSQIVSYSESEARKNNDNINLDNAKIEHLNSQEAIDEQNTFAKKQAELAVQRYAMTAIMYGEEIITWKYSKVLDSYIPSQAILRQYEYGGKTMSVNLDLNNVLTSSINDVSDVDVYMGERQRESIRKFIDSTR